MITATQTNPHERRTHEDRQSERVNMRRLYLLMYPLCLMAAVAARLTDHSDAATAKPAQSIFAEARASAYAAAGYAFQA
ncbi:hypothetical protein ACSV9I_18855 [Rhizobium sp. G187]|uniref:hypothetical protein n=1 Tax=Rhizobium sp. G187 TaxID=3451352 RepID=UPI003EE468FC